MSTWVQDYMGTCLRGQFPLPAEEEERRPAGPVRPQQEPPVQYSKVYSVQCTVSSPVSGLEEGSREYEAVILTQSEHHGHSAEPSRPHLHTLIRLVLSISISISISKSKSISININTARLNLSGRKGAEQKLSVLGVHGMGLA